MSSPSLSRGVETTLSVTRFDKTIDNHHWRFLQRPTRSQSAHVEHQRGRRGSRLARRSSPASAILSRISVSRESFTSSLVVLPFWSRLSTSRTSARCPVSSWKPDRVDVQLVAGDVLGLGALGGLEVNDRRLAGV